MSIRGDIEAAVFASGSRGSSQHDPMVKAFRLPRLLDFRAVDQFSFERSGNMPRLGGPAIVDVGAAVGTTDELTESLRTGEAALSLSHEGCAIRVRALEESRQKRERISLIRGREQFELVRQVHGLHSGSVTDRTRKSKNPTVQSLARVPQWTDNGSSDSGLCGPPQAGDVAHPPATTTRGLRFSEPMQTAFALAHQCGLQEIYMTTEYTIPAIPTLYKGRQYRSRLEARWAAFFDLLTWRHEYEPFDIHGWIPDFLIYGKNAPVLVEIKPFTSLKQFDTAKIEKALADTSYCGTEILLLGVAPTTVSKMWESWESYETCSIGWLGEFCESPWSKESESWYDETYNYGLAPLTDPPGFTHEELSYGERINGFAYKEYALMRKSKADHLWAEAANAVQWKSPRRR